MSEARIMKLFTLEHLHAKYAGAGAGGLWTHVKVLHQV